VPGADPAEIHNVEPALNMLNYINVQHAPSITKIDASEKTFIGNVFTKIYNEKDKKRQKTLMENFLLNLKDSYGEGVPVCITGRTTRILTTFADMDNENPTLGILTSKPVIRNEILTKAASVRNKVLEEATPEIQRKYNDGVTDCETEYLEKTILENIHKMINADYVDLCKNDAKFIKSVIDDVVNAL
jgi:hypothetical protein